MSDCSKTLDFSKEFKRMCDTYCKDSCHDCPLDYSKTYDCAVEDITQEVIDIVQKWSDEHPDIKPCPFCGKTEAAHIKYDKHSDMVQVICDYTKGGCGSSTGFKYCDEEAWKLWNKRVDVK